MTLKRLASFITLFAVSFVGFSIVNGSSVSAARLVWNPGGSNNNTSTAGNWTPAQAPQAGDTLEFTPKSANETVNVDSPALESLLVTTNENNSYTFTGQVTAKTIRVAGSGSADFNLSKLLLDDGTGSGSAIIDAGTNSRIFFNVNVVEPRAEQVINEVAFVGSGNITLSKFGSGTGFNTRLTDSVTVTAPAAVPGNLTLASTSRFVSTQVGGHRVAEGETRLGANTELSFIIDRSITVAGDIKPSAGSIISAVIAVNSYEDTPYTLTLSGDIIFVNGDFKYIGNEVDLKLTGSLTNASGMRIILPDGSGGSLTIAPASGKTNSSAIPNGTINPAVKTTTITDASSDFMNVFKNNIVIINGKRGNVLIYSGGVLKGTGTVGMLNADAGARVAPGQSPGCLSAGATQFLEGSTFEVEIAGNTVCTEYDQLKVAGTVSLGSATLDLKFLNGFKPAMNGKFVIIDNDGSDAVSGTFKDLAEGANVTIDGVVFKISYVGGDGNDVVLTAIGGNIAGAPTTPNTGAKLLLASPLVTLAGTVTSAGALFVLARKYSLFAK